jgi:hypothetical protein
VRLALAIAFGAGALVALAIGSGDLCDGFDRDRSLAAVVTGVCIGGLVGTLLSGWFRTRPQIPWAIGLATAIVVFFGFYVVFIMAWVGECSR